MKASGLRSPLPTALCCRSRALGLCFLASGCIFITAEDIRGRDPGTTPETPATITVSLAAVDPDPAAAPIGPTAACVPGGQVSPTHLRRTDGAITAGGAPVTAGIATLDPGRQVVTGTRDGYAPGFAIVDVTAGGAGTVSVPLVRAVSTELAFPDRGGAVIRDCTFSLSFAAGSLGAEGGAADVHWAWVEPGSPGGPDKITGDGRPLDAIAMMWFGGVTRGNADVPVTEATLRVDVPEGDPRRALALGVWTWDDATAAFTEVGDAGEEPGYVTATVTAPGWYAIGAPQGALSCASGVFTSSSGVLGNAEVTSIAGDRPGQWRAHSGADGAFCVPVEPALTGTVAFVGVSADGTAAWTASAPYPTGVAGATCEGTCISLGTVSGVRHADSDGDGSFARGETDGVGPWDCDDTSADASPDVADAPGDGLDLNCDGTDGIDADGDGAAAGADCNDADPLRHPGRAEICNGVDDDCDARVDGQDVDLVGATLSEEGTCHPCDASAVMALGPKLYWRLAETDVNRAHDSSGFGNDGDIVGLLERYDGVTDAYETAPRFPGILSDYVRLAQFDEMNTDAVSISLWMRPQSARRTLVSYAIPSQGTEDEVTSAANELALTGPNTDSLQVRIEDQGNTFTRDEVELPQLAWSHVVMTWEKNGTWADRNLKIYVDGVLRSETLLTEDAVEEAYPYDTGLPVYPASLDPGGVLFLGQNQDTWGTTAADASLDSFQAYEGMFDEFAVFDRVLKPSEVESLYLGATCGEVCVDVLDDDSEDGDPYVNEPYLGSQSCAAADCAEIADNRSSMGDGYYHLDNGELAFCDMDAPDGPLTQYCGDGVVFNDPEHPFETCDGGAGCTECAIEVPAANHCADLAANGFDVNGPYWVDDPTNPGTLIKVLCLLEGSDPGWTLVFAHDSAQGTVFAHPIFLPNPGQVDILAMPSTLADPVDPQGGANAYSILDRLGAMAGPTGYAFRLTWPFDSQAVYTWHQVSNPAFDPDTSDTAAEPVVGYADDLVVSTVVGPNPDPDFGGLQRRGDDLAFISGEFTLDYTIGVYIGGLQGPQGGANHLLASDLISDDGTARKAELWVKPW